MSVIQRKAYKQAFDLSLSKNRWTVPTGGADTFTVSAEAITTWASGVITVYRSNDGITGYAQETAMTLTAAGMKDQTDCSGYPYLIFEVTTTESVFVNLTVNFTRSVDS